MQIVYIEDLKRNEVPNKSTNKDQKEAKGRSNTKTKTSINFF